MTVDDGDLLSDAEKAEVRDILGYGGSLPDGKQNVHTFLFSVATAEDTTRLGYLKEEEIGTMSNPVRAFKHLSLFAKDIMKKEGLSEYFNKNSEIATSTSLSRDGFLIDKAVTQRRILSDGDKKPRKENKSWFKKKGGGEVSPDES